MVKPMHTLSNGYYRPGSIVFTELQILIWAVTPILWIFGGSIQIVTRNQILPRWDTVGYRFTLKINRHGPMI